MNPTNVPEDDEEWQYVPKGMTEQELEENIKYFKNHPLFMREQPEDIENNKEFQALQHLAFDDTPENVARNCNERGNALYKKGPDLLFYIKEALKSYEEGIEVKCNDAEINTKLLSNRTLINLKLKNYGRVITDCKKIIEINPKFIKAYFRHGSALYFVNKYDEALTVIDQGLKFQNDNKELLDLKDEVLKKIKTIHDREKSKISQKEKDFNALTEKLKAKNIMLGQRTMELPEAYAKTLEFDGNNVLHAPLLIYYPEFQQTDFVQDTKETDILLDHLVEVFQNGIPWDANKDYVSFDRLKCFIHLNSTSAFYKLKGFDPQKYDPQVQTFKSINVKLSIREILQIPGHVIPMVLEIYVLSEKSKFLDMFVGYNKIIG